MAQQHVNKNSQLPTRLEQTPRFARTLVKILIICFFVIPLLMLFLPCLQSIQGAGKVVAFSPTERKQTVDAPVNGIIKKWYAQEGQTVKAGDALLEISDVDPLFSDRLGDQLTNTQSRLSAKKDELKSYQLQLESYYAVRDNRISSARFKVDMAKQKVRTATEAIASSEATLETSKFQIARMERLLGDGLVSIS